MGPHFQISNSTMVEKYECVGANPCRKTGFDTNFTGISQYNVQITEFKDSITSSKSLRNKCEVEEH